MKTNPMQSARSRTEALPLDPTRAAGKTRCSTAQSPAVPSAFQIKSILVPIDFSVPSKQVLEYAASFAEQFKAKLTLLHVAEPVSTDFPTFPVIISNEKILTACKAQLELLVKQFAPTPRLVEQIIVRQGRSYHEITEAARVLNSDLILIATRGRTGLKHVLLGSTAERVVRHAACPVLVIPPREKGTLKSPDTLKKILVPVDFSVCSSAALSYSIQLARRLQSELALLHVVAPVPYYGEGDSALYHFGVPEPDYAAIEAEMRDECANRLSIVRTQEVNGQVPAKSVVQTGFPASEIIEFARKWPADLIVISTHGRTGLKHVFLGSVAEQVVRRAPCPVLVARQRSPAPVVKRQWVAECATTITAQAALL